MFFPVGFCYLLVRLFAMLPSNLMCHYTCHLNEYDCVCIIFVIFDMFIEIIVAFVFSPFDIDVHSKLELNRLVV